MSLRPRLLLIPAPLILGLALLSIASAQSTDQQPPSAVAPANHPSELENYLKSALEHYQTLSSRLHKATTRNEASSILSSTRSTGYLSPFSRDQCQKILNSNPDALSVQEQKNILNRYIADLQKVLGELSSQLRILDIQDSDRTLLTGHDITKAGIRLLHEKPEETEVRVWLQDNLEQLRAVHQLLSDIRTLNDRQEAEKSDILDTWQNNLWIPERQSVLNQLPLDARKRLYAQYIPLMRQLLPDSPVNSGVRYHYIVYQSEYILQCLSQQFEALYILQKAQEQLSEPSPADFPADMPEKEFLIRQNIALTQELNDLLSKTTGKAAAAASAPRANDLKDRLLQNRALLVSADDVSPEEQSRIDTQYSQTMQQATDELNRQLQRLASKNSYRNDLLAWAVDELSPKQNSAHSKNEPVSSKQTEETPPEPNEN